MNKQTNLKKRQLQPSNDIQKTEQSKKVNLVIESKKEEEMVQEQNDFIDQVNRSQVINKESQGPEGFMERLKSQRTLKDSEMFYINNHLKNHKYNNNKIDTSKYNFITFLPKSLLFQFYRLANVYFVIIAIIQSIKVISPLSSETAVAPICVVLAASILREAYEDIIRHRYDSKLNKQKVTVYKEGTISTTSSEDLRVGDVIILKENEEIPVDCILLDSGLIGGQCFIETATLDGEKTLKVRHSPKELRGVFFDTDQAKGQNDKNEEALYLNKDKAIVKKNSNANGLFPPESLHLAGSVVRELPNHNLHAFDGTLDLKIEDRSGKYQEFPSFPLDINNMLLRGAILKNTPIVLAVVVYTGHKTKLMLNSKPGRIKFSELEMIVSKLLIMIFIIQIIFCIIAAILYNPYYSANLSMNPFAPLQVYGYPVDSIINFFTYQILLNTMIPISLIITLEIVKTIQGYFISHDCSGYSHVRKAFIKAGSISLNEELGNINFIFSDKTGTLTCNKMKFKFGLIGEFCFDLTDEGNQERVIDDTMQILSKSRLNQVKQEMKDEYFRLLSIAHECDTHETNGVYTFTGASPDDVELVTEASRNGFTSLPSFNPSIRNIKTENGVEDYSIELVNEFTSKRKRMSIVVSESNETYTVYIKGADSEILKRLSSKVDLEHISVINRYISYFASQGLRVLMLGRKNISREEFIEFKAKFNLASLDLLNKASAIERVVDDFEKDFQLVGATIVEDKLQDKVPETIMKMKLAGIKVWMLTGDSVDTAKKIGLSCSLISPKEKVFSLVTNSKDDFTDFINDYYDYMDYVQKESVNDQNITDAFSIVVSSDALLRIFESSNLTKEFYTIASRAKAVIGCRVSPLQKATVVKEMMKFDPSAKTLAIGDGGNDVSMIMEANIGVGVYGEEGMRAVQASDYAIGEFKILQRLLFFHGRLSLLRISRLIYYFFYKNFAFTLAHFYYLFLNNASGQSIFEDWFITLYNLLYTAIPIGVLACTEIDIRDEDGELVKEMNPFIYKISRDQPLFTKIGFIGNMFKGAVISCIQFLVIIYGLDTAAINNKGDQPDLWGLSFVYFTSLFFLVSFSLLIMQRYHTLLSSLVMLIISWALYFISLAIFNNFLYFRSSGSYTVLLTSSRVYLLIILNTVIGSMIEYAFKVYEYMATPDIVNMMELLRVAKSKILESKDLAMSVIPYCYYLEKYEKIE